ncbi:MAG TPA: metallophosphoesterase [Bryobacteraceae bacterium]|nr:metallophosphoesterase [Bryobacteraceae bacterium]
MKRSIFVFCALLGGFAAGQHDAAIEFIHVTDTHVTDLKQVSPPLVKAREHFSDGERRLAALLAGTGRPSTASFALITGDLIDAFSYEGRSADRVFGQLDAFRRATARSSIPLYLALGNHDIAHYGLAPDGVKPMADQSVAAAARAAWTRSMECFRDGTYYEFSKQSGSTRYVFLMLDNGYTAAGAAAGQQGVRIAHEQLYWLRRRAAANRDAIIVLAMHIPLGKDGTSEAIRSAVSEAPNIGLILAGHNHRDQVEELVLGASTAVQVRTAALGYGANNCRRIRLLPDRIEIYKTGAHEELERTVVAGRTVRPAA